MVLQYGDLLLVCSNNEKIQIPRLGKAGIMFEPTVAFDWELKGGISLSYGFQLTVGYLPSMTLWA